MPTGTKLLVALAACAAVVAACESSTTDTTAQLSYAGFMLGSKVKPTAIVTTANGQILVTVNDSGSLSYSATWSGLSGVPTTAQIRGPADSTTATANVLIDFAALPAGSVRNVANVMTAAGSSSGVINVKSTAVITGTVSGDSLMKLLNAGLLYATVQTGANAGGEIRAQIIKQ